ELGLEKMITFVGRVDQLRLPAYYKAADVFALPSYHESFGLVTLESLACGTPVVATNVGGLSEFIRPGRTGYLIENNVPRAMARKISVLTSKNPNGIAPPEAIRASVAGYEWSSVAGAIVQEYRSVLKGWPA
ncbi:MAG: glycosyltransferase, partial [Deltaproteobacteria bacterium]|nr:glycosyltransferase [Deltaproteobacteria bacterium]